MDDFIRADKTITPTINNSKLAYKNKFFQVHEDELVTNNGSNSFSYFWIENKYQGVVVLAKTEEDKFILNLEYRHPLKQFVLGLPGGFKEQSEDVVETASRELFEETGYTASDYKLIGEYNPLIALCTQKVFFVEAKNAKLISEPSREETEFISTIQLSYNELMNTIKNKKMIVDSLLITALGCLSISNY